ncbi:MAG: protein kinase [Myxococcales bacterium]|nr:protein kinase [Myxococcales bacterium]
METLGPYRLVRTIGVGGMGEVFLATLERAAGFEKQVALKCVLPGRMADPAFVEMFEREARHAAALTHRHIVQIFDFGRDGGRAWLAMEYVHGVDLRAVLDRVGGPLPPGIAVEVAEACARALDYAHRARDAAGRPLRLVHRDVSPQNVLLSFEGDVKLADFGLADTAAAAADEGTLRGKFGYMAPEQARGRAVDARTDQFALGVVLYEMLGGARAFGPAGAPADEVLARATEGAPLEPLEARVPEALASLVRVVDRAMAPAAAARYADTGAFADALRAAADACGVRPGELALGPWLATRFPTRAAAALVTAPPASGLDVTATAGALAREATATAAAPVRRAAAGGSLAAGDPSPARRPGAAATRRLDRRPPRAVPSVPVARRRRRAVLASDAGSSASAGAPELSAVSAPAEVARRRAGVPVALLALGLAVVGALWALSPSVAPWGRRDAGPADAGARARVDAHPPTRPRRTRGRPTSARWTRGARRGHAGRHARDAAPRDAERPPDRGRPVRPPARVVTPRPRPDAAPWRLVAARRPDAAPAPHLVAAWRPDAAPALRSVDAGRLPRSARPRWTRGPRCPTGRGCASARARRTCGGPAQPCAAGGRCPGTASCCAFRAARARRRGCACGRGRPTSRPRWTRGPGRR